MLVLIQSLLKQKKNKHFLTHFMRSVLPWILKPDKDRTDTYRTLLHLEHRCKNSQQNISKYIPAIHKKDNISQPSGIHHRNARLIQDSKPNQSNSPN